MHNICKKNQLNYLKKQINLKLFSAYAYYKVAEYYCHKGLDRFHKYLKKQSQEEIEHVERFSKYLQDLNVNVQLYDIKVLNKDFKYL